MINFGKIKKVLVFACLVSQFSEAQVIPGNMAPELKTKAAVDSNGIDLVGGEPLIGGISMSIGPNTGGISVVDNSFNGLRTNYRGSIRVLTSTGSLTDCEKLPAGSFYSVTNGKETAVFKAVSSTVFTLHRGRGKLTYDSVNYIYTDLAGVEYKYEKFTLSFEETSLNTTACSISPLATMTKITMPSGEVIDINYNKNGGHFDSIVSSLGWMFKRDYISLSGDRKTTAGQTAKYKFTFVNRTEEYCGVGTGVSCTNLSSFWPKYSLEKNYSQVGNQSSFLSSPATISYNSLLTNPNGKTTRLNYAYTRPTASYDTFLTSPTGLVKTYRKKMCDMNGQLATEEDCSTLNSKRVVKFFQGTASFDYILGFYTGGPSYNEPPNLLPHAAKGPDGTVLYIPVVSSYPYAFFDDLSRSYTQSYTSSWLLEEVGYLNDSRTKAIYDSRGNVTSITQLPKVTGATPLTTSFTYPPESTCTTSPKTCNKPDTITESNGVTTTYTYHPQSGYVETVTKPAVNNVQAQTRYKYE